jgi:hypothetical protein
MRRLIKQLELSAQCGDTQIRFGDHFYWGRK